MASASSDSTVKIWDLRKLKVVQDFNVGNAAHSVSFDHSGKHLAIGANDVHVYHVASSKKVNLLKTFDDATSTVTGLKFEYNSQYLAASSMDRSLRFYSASE